MTRCIAIIIACSIGMVRAELVTVQQSSGVGSSLSIGVKSWKSIRDARVIKQDQDFSCGSASIATLLNEFYGENYNENDFVKAMDKGDNKASFEDMARVMPLFGYKAQGFASSWEQLTQLKMPVIVYLKYRRDDHFSVIRGINGSTVWLADPSFGNRFYSKEQFLEMWQTRNDEEAIETRLRGKFLAILPLKTSVTDNSFFTNQPVRRTSISVKSIGIRNF